MNKRVQSSSHYIENSYRNKINIDDNIKTSINSINNNIINTNTGVNIAKPGTPVNKIHTKIRKSGVISLHHNGNISYA